MITPQVNELSLRPRAFHVINKHLSFLAKLSTAFLFTFACSRPRGVGRRGRICRRNTSPSLFFFARQIPSYYRGGIIDARKPGISASRLERARSDTYPTCVREIERLYLFDVYNINPSVFFSRHASSRPRKLVTIYNEKDEKEAGELERVSFAKQMLNKS